ncbi:ubiquitin binding protein [Pholiota conissans]|uniref:Vacuolar protein sorting-associated protein 27 n=1 Tax=Pholiota conissans TaxID=109636 RepID=A0A9P5Z7S0_9AGAR|nr:ubiquitin binding protein [Pholiota conissans]
MSGLGSWIWGTSQLDDAIDKATSELLPAGGEDIALNLEICDQIRSKSAPAKDAMRALKRRLNHKNPNVQLLALSLTDICIKNGGDLFLTEVASREFVDNLVSILKVPALNHDVKQAILRFVQNWSVALEGKPNLNYVGQVYKTLQSEGYKFPPKDLAVANSAMVDTQTAPEWIDSEVCLRCRTPFSFTNRKHHCRNCGQVFDQTCSSKTMALPHFGITQEVRVCDGCHSKLTKKAEKAHKAHRHSSSLHGHRHKSAREIADAELQRAIQLSLEEVNGTSGRSRAGYVPSEPSPTKWSYSEPPIVDRSTYPNQKPAQADDDDDPDLKAAIEASLREASAPKPSAPVVVETPRSEESSFNYAGPGYSQSYPPASAVAQPPLPELPNYDLQPLEADAILTFNQTVEQVDAQGGRDLSRYPAVTQLYDKASGLRPKLALSLDDAGRKEQMLTDMHDKLSQAVKLYDQILTQQIAQPRWRTAPTTQYQPQQPVQNPGYAPNGYSQWGAQQQTSYAPTPEVQQPMSPREAYAPTPQRVLAPNSEIPQPQQYQQSPYQQQPQYAPPALVTSPPPPPQQQYAQTPYQAYATATPAASVQTPGPTPFVQTPASIPSSAYYTPSAPSVQPQSPTMSTSQQYQAPSIPQSPPARTSSLAYSSFASPPPQVPVAPVQQPQPQPQQQYQAPPPQQQAPPQQHQQQPAYQVASPPPAVVALPQFPSAPTNIPQPSFAAYAPSPAFEKKEALLIDL